MGKGANWVTLTTEEAQGLVLRPGDPPIIPAGHWGGTGGRQSPVVGEYFRAAKHHAEICHLRHAGQIQACRSGQTATKPPGHDRAEKTGQSMEQPCGFLQGPGQKAVKWLTPSRGHCDCQCHSTIAVL